MRIPYYFLFAGPPKLTPKGTIAMSKKSLAPIQNKVVLIDPPHGNDPLPLITDGKGALHRVTDSFKRSRVYYAMFPGFIATIHMPPPELVMHAWAAKGMGWAKALSDFFKTQQGQVLACHKLHKDMLRDPKPKPQKGDDPDALYRTWFERITKESDPTFYGFVIAQTRAVVMLFTEKALLRAKVRLSLIRRTDSKKNKKRIKSLPDANVSNPPGTKLLSAVIHGSSEQLPRGIYAIRVSPEDPTKLDKGRWNQGVYNKDQGYYELREHLTFGITNIAGEFDVINADPISVEETMMLQFPSKYAHLVTAAWKKSTFPDADLSAKPLPEALQPWAERLATAYQRAKFGVGLLNADSSSDIGKKLGETLLSGIKPENAVLQEIRKGIEVGYSLYKNAEGVPKSITTLQDYLLRKEGFKQYIDQTVLNISKKNQWDTLHKVLNQTFVDSNFEPVEGKTLFEFIEKKCKNDIIVGRLSKISGEEREALLAAALPEKQTYLWKLVGKKTAKGINKALPWLDVGLSGYELSKAVQAYQSAKEKLTEIEIQFRELADLYVKDFGTHGFRSGIGLLEKNRVASVLNKMKKKEAADNAAEKAIDLVLGIVALIPGVNEVAGVIIAIKALGSAAINALTTFAGWVDKYLFEFQVSNLFGMNPTLQDIRKHSQHNQLLMLDEIKACKKANKNLEIDPRVQFRIRAEAIYGLAALLTRASISYEVTSAKRGEARKKRYFEKIKQYHVKEYIQVFLLHDGWQVPFRPPIPMTLDQFWLYIIGPKHFTNPMFALIDFGINHPLAREALKKGPGMWMGIFSSGARVDRVKKKEFPSKSSP